MLLFIIHLLIIVSEKTLIWFSAQSIELPQYSWLSFHLRYPGHVTVVLCYFQSAWSCSWPRGTSLLTASLKPPRRGLFTPVEESTPEPFPTGHCQYRSRHLPTVPENVSVTRRARRSTGRNQIVDVSSSSTTARRPSSRWTRTMSTTAPMCVRSDQVYSWIG